MPADVGLLSYGRRRTKGLRREELAQLAGVSSDYVTRLEQGRWQTPSTQVVASLARALQLNRAESELLYRSAGLAAPGRGGISVHVPPGVQRMMVRMADLPLAVFAADWTLLMTTPVHDALFVRPSATAVPGQNLAIEMLVTGSSVEVVYPDGVEAFQSAIVADLRRTASYAAGDPGFVALVARLRAESPRFVELWAEGCVAEHQSLVMRVIHPEVGEVAIDSDMLVVPDSDLRVAVCTAVADSDAAEKLARLRLRPVTARARS